MRNENNQTKHCISACYDSYTCNECNCIAAPNADQNTFSLTLNKAVKGHTYEAYQILSGDLSADKATLSNIKWGEGITEAGQTALGGDAASYAENSVVLVTTLQSLKSRRRLLVQT